jgi:hypothetical protein
MNSIEVTATQQMIEDVTGLYKMYYRWAEVAAAHIFKYYQAGNTGSAKMVTDRKNNNIRCAKQIERYIKERGYRKTWEIYFW